jgi:hypothetical protein
VDLANMLLPTVSLVPILLESMLHYVLVLLDIMKILTVLVKNVTTLVPPVLLITLVPDVMITKEDN